MNLEPAPFYNTEIPAIWRQWLNRVYVMLTGVRGGVANVADGGTVAHGFVDAPEWVICTASTSGEFVSVTAIGASTFTVAIKKHDNSAGTTQDIYWRAGLA